MMVAWYISKFNLPPRTWHILLGFIVVCIPTLLIAKQPDLGTSLLVASSGVFALFLAGMSWKLIAIIAVLAGCVRPHYVVLPNAGLPKAARHYLLKP